MNNKIESKNQNDSLAPATKVQKLSFKTLLFIILFIIVGNLITYIAWIYSHQSNQQTSKVLIEEIDKTKNSLQTLQTLQTSLAEIKQTLEKQQHSITKNQEALTKINATQKNDTTDISLAKIEYILELAQLNLQWQRNIPNVISLLQLAEKQLTEANVPSFTSFKQQLQEKINLLKEITPLNKNELVLELNQIMSYIPTLPLKPVVNTASATNQKTESTKASEATITLPKWRQMLSESLDTLQKIVIIRRHDEAVKPLLAPEQRVYLEHNIQRLLEQAQWALLHDDADLYQQNLKQTMTWLNQYFEMQTEKNQQLIQKITTLSEKNINPTLPDLNDLLKDFKNLKE